MSRFLISGPDRLSCDVLVIGSGAGGACIAATLADAGVSVLILEQGPYIPAADAPRGLGESVLKMWRGAGLIATMGGAQISLGEGCCVGGGTEINSAIFQRAPEGIIDRWALTNHLRDFSMASLAPYYERAAAAVNASFTSGDLGAPTQILARAGDAMGWRVSTLERGHRNCVGANLCAAGCPTGGKQSMSSTLIPHALKRGARLIAQCSVRRLRMRGTRAIGAIAEATDGDGRNHKVEVLASAVFLCAGAVQTPILIRRSGIRSRVGRTFQVHPTVRVLARYREPVRAHQYRLPLAAITEFAPTMRFGGSFFTVANYAVALAEDWATRSSWLPDYAQYAMYYAMIKPDGAGRIMSPLGGDNFIVRYVLTERDWRHLGEGLRKLSLALLSGGAERVVPSIRGHEGWRDTDQLSSPGAIVLSRSRTMLMSIHMFGSCPMGQGSELFPVDSYGRLIGTDNIVVADGSVLPAAPGVNPQATIMALALRAADMYLHVRKGEA